MSVQNSELHDRIAQPRAISTAEIFRTAFLCRLPVRTAYKHILETRTRVDPHASTFINLQPQGSLSLLNTHAHTCKHPTFAVTPKRVPLLFLCQSEYDL